MAGAVESSCQEECIQYYLFLSEGDFCRNEEMEMVLEEKALDVKALLASYIQQYIWHKDAFNVTPRAPCRPHVSREQKKEDDLPPHLYGSTCYGDNVEDEWFIVFLLMELTKQIEGLVVRVIDSDGEFLLIEAAEFLPCWATPERCDKRVYLYGGAVHIIPLEDLTEEPPSLSVCDALKVIRENPKHTIASPAIQKAIESRFEGYPVKIRELLHEARAYVPVGVAAVLKARPDLIAPAVLAFCNRDPLDMKACSAMRYFPPENRIMCNVMFTKCLYAMILYHKYNPDRRTGWNMPSPSDPQHKAHSLGMKLACGFEILVAQGKPSRKSETDKFDVSSHRLWPKYLKSLQQHGFFQNFLEGSKDYNLLLQKARNYFTSYCANLPTDSSYGQEIFDLLGNLDYSSEDLKRDEETLRSPDDESWLELCPQELDNMLKQRYGKPPTSGENSKSTDITGQLTKFLNYISDIEGAEFPSDSTPPTRPKRGIKLHKGIEKKVAQASKSEEGCSESGNKIMFDADQFSCAVQNILDFVVPEDSWDLESDGSSMSSYEDEVDMDLDQLKKGKGKTKMPNSELKQYMDQMDRELASTTIGESFEKSSDIKKKNNEEDSFDDIEDFKPVDIDRNAVKHILESYEAQMGGAGPASTLLGPMGVRLDAKTSSAKITEP